MSIQGSQRADAPYGDAYEGVGTWDVPDYVPDRQQLTARDAFRDVSNADSSWSPRRSSAPPGSTSHDDRGEDELTAQPDDARTLFPSGWCPSGDTAGGTLC